MKHPNAEMIMQVAQWIADGQKKFEYKSLPLCVFEYAWVPCNALNAMINSYRGAEVRLNIKDDF